MKTTPPEDVAAMFDLSPLPPAAPSDESATEAAEAALAAEIALTLESGGVAADAPDSRTNLRVDVSWPARMRLASGDVIELEVRNISETGVGLVSDEHVPAYTVVNFEMEVPPLGDGGQAAPVEGTIKTTYTTVHGPKILFGGTWVQVPPAGLEFVRMWVERLRR